MHSVFSRISIGRAVGTALCGLVAIATVGCGGGPKIPSTEPVGGTVTLKGKPIEGVEVYFISEKLVAYGKTDASGHYDLVQGAVAGPNKVYFSKKPAAAASKFQPGDGMDDYQMQMAANSGGTKSTPPKELIPAEYADPVKPKLEFLVPDGGSKTADFKL